MEGKAPPPPLLHKNFDFNPNENPSTIPCSAPQKLPSFSNFMKLNRSVIKNQNRGFHKSLVVNLLL